MNALSKLLAKVAIRAIAKSHTESELLTVADKVISWQPLILEDHINAIAESMEEHVDDVTPEETPEVTPEPESYEEEYPE